MPASNTENKVKFGISNVVYAMVTAVDEDGKPTYGEWKKLPYAVSLTADVNSNTSSDYADNKLVFSYNSITGATITLEVTHLTDDFKKDVLGWKAASDGGLLQPTDNIKPKIALGFQIDGDAKKSKRWFFLCSVSDPAGDSASTNTESVTFAHDSITLTAYPVVIGTDGISYLKQTIREGDTGYANACVAGKTPTLPTIAGA